MGTDLAGVVVECPTNPLIQVADLRQIAAAVRGVGGVLMVDPTIASIYNVAVLPHADLLVTSLTKYAACRGDVMIGAVALNPDSPFYGDLVLRCSAHHQPPYARDLAQLAEEMREATTVRDRVNANTKQIAAYLKAHSAVKAVHYAGDATHFPTVAKAADSAGSVVSIELNGPMPEIFDALPMLKGPSFGTHFSLICPFMYLAHYDLVSQPEGRAFLRSVGIEPDLLRLSVGTEPVGAIIECLERALGRAEETLGP
jgi:cystathionine gamma-synthase